MKSSYVHSYSSVLYPDNLACLNKKKPCPFHTSCFFWDFFNKLASSVGTTVDITKHWNLQQKKKRKGKMLRPFLALKRHWMREKKARAICQDVPAVERQPGCYSHSSLWNNTHGIFYWISFSVTYSQRLKLKLKIGWKVLIMKVETFYWEHS